MTFASIFKKALSSRFLRAGFTYETAGNLEGWLSRDPNTNDWILWSAKTKQMYRRRDWHKEQWHPSSETEQQCLKLGQVYAELIGIK